MTKSAGSKLEKSTLQSSPHDARTLKLIEAGKAFRKGNLSPRDQGRLKDVQTMKWMAEFIYSSEAILMKAHGWKARGQLLKLERAGLVKRLEANTKAGFVWILTPAGVRFAEGCLEKDIHYPTQPTKISQANMKHDMAAQWYLAAACQRIEITEWKSCLRWRRENDYWIPDLIVKWHGKYFGIEIERTLKTGKELENKLRRIINETCIFRDRITDEEFFNSSPPTTRVKLVGAHFVSHHPGIKKYKQDFSFYANDWAWRNKFDLVHENVITIEIIKNDLALIV